MYLGRTCSQCGGHHRLQAFLFLLLLPAYTAPVLPVQMRRRALTQEERMLRNREAAAKSRARRHQYQQSLEQHILALQTHSAALRRLLEQNGISLPAPLREQQAALGDGLPPPPRRNSPPRSRKGIGGRPRKYPLNPDGSKPTRSRRRTSTGTALTTAGWEGGAAEQAEGGEEAAGGGVSEGAGGTAGGSGGGARGGRGAGRGRRGAGSRGGKSAARGGRGRGRSSGGTRRDEEEGDDGEEGHGGSGQEEELPGARGAASGLLGQSSDPPNTSGTGAGGSVVIAGAVQEPRLSVSALTGLAKTQVQAGAARGGGIAPAWSQPQPLGADGAAGGSGLAGASLSAPLPGAGGGLLAPGGGGQQGVHGGAGGAEAAEGAAAGQQHQDHFDMLAIGSYSDLMTTLFSEGQ